MIKIKYKIHTMASDATARTRLVLDFQHHYSLLEATVPEASIALSLPWSLRMPMVTKAFLK